MGEINMAGDPYVLRVVYKSEKIELHEYNNKQKAMQARDKFRKLDTVESAKIISGGAD